MGNCFTGDDTNPPPPPKEGGALPRSTASDSPEMDPRLVSLLDFSRQLYLRRNELFSEVIPRHGDEIAEVFKKIKKVEERINGRPGSLQARMKRSHSAGAVLTAARGVELGDGGGDLKDYRFKVKTLDMGEAPPPAGQGGGGGTKTGGGGK